MDGLLLIVTIAVMGGAIAYIGDKLGTKVGKKKLMIFGLRPKHTSIVVTIFTGILIAAITLGLLASSSQNVRTALFGMKTLKVQLSQLHKEVLSKNFELEASREALEAKNTEYSTLSAKITETSAKLARITADLAQVTAERDKTAVALQVAQQDYNTKLAELSATRDDLAKAKNDIDSLQVTKKDLDIKVTDLNVEKDKFQNEVTGLYDYTHGQAIIARGNEPLARIVLKGGRSKEITERELKTFLAGANQLIAKRKLKLDDRIVLHVNPAEVEQAITILVANQEEFIVDIFAAQNTFIGEYITGHIGLTPNRLVYLKGIVIQTSIIDLGAGRSSLELQGVLRDFLENKLNADALKKGIKINPSYNSVGKISGEEFFQIVGKLQKMKGKIEISATARQDIFTIGPVEVELKVRSLE